MTRKLLLMLSRNAESDAMQKPLSTNDLDWRRATRSQVLWILLAKLAGLMLLWFFFFSPGHRQRVDGEATGSHFAAGGTDAPH